MVSVLKKETRKTERNPAKSLTNPQAAQPGAVCRLAEHLRSKTQGVL